MTYVTSFFGMIFDWINGLTGSYGWTIVLFTILFRLVLSPVDIRSRVGQRKYMQQMQKIQPQMDLINKAYKDDPQKAQAKIMALRKQEGIGIFPKGCGTMLLTYPILIAFFAVFRNLAGERLAELAALQEAGDAAGVQAWFSTNSFLWIKNIWQPDVAFNFSEVWGIRKIVIINGINGNVIPSQTELASLLKSAYNNSLSLKAAYPDVATLTQYVETNLEPLRETYNASIVGNGLYILPILAGAAQFISLKLTPQTPTVGTDAQTQQSAKTGKIMKIFFPILFVYFCLVSSSALAIYWIASSLCMILLTYLINLYYRRKDEKDAGSKGA